MRTHEELARCLEMMLQGTRHGVDFLVGHPIDRTTNEQAGEAFIMDWTNTEIPQPTVEAIETFWDSNQTEIKRKASVPHSVSRFQAKAALMEAGLLTQVETVMADPGTPSIAKIAWVEARDFARRSPTINTLGASLGLTEEQIDDLFISAAGITA